jgi:hypothetical protein
MTQQLALIYGHDDQVIAELAIPRLLHQIEMPRMRTWYSSTFDPGSEASMEPLPIHVDIYVPDRRESILLQVAYSNPNVWAYRRRE